MERHSGTESAQYLAAHNGNIRVSMDTLADTYVGQVSASYDDWNIGVLLIHLQQIYYESQYWHFQRWQ